MFGKGFELGLQQRETYVDYQDGVTGLLNHNQNTDRCMGTPIILPSPCYSFSCNLVIHVMNELIEVRHLTQGCLQVRLWTLGIEASTFGLGGEPPSRYTSLRKTLLSTAA